MGYESKIIVINRCELKDDDGKTTWIHGAEIAQFDLCKMGYDYFDGVIAWMEQYEAHEHYRRAALFLDFLRVLKNRTGEYTQICLVHYGY